MGASVHSASVHVAALRSEMMRRTMTFTLTNSCSSLPDSHLSIPSILSSNGPNHVSRLYWSQSLFHQRASTTVFAFTGEDVNTRHALQASLLLRSLSQSSVNTTDARTGWERWSCWDQRRRRRKKRPQRQQEVTALLRRE